MWYGRSVTENDSGAREEKGQAPGKKKVLALILAAAVVGGGIGWKHFSAPKASAAAVAYQTAAAERRDITDSLSSSGTLEPGPIPTQ